MTPTGKAGQTAVQKPKLSKQRSLITKTDALTGELYGLPWNEWSEDDQNDLFNALSGVHSKTEELLSAMNPQLAEAESNPPDLPSLS